MQRSVVKKCGLLQISGPSSVNNATGNLAATWIILARRDCGKEWMSKLGLLGLLFLSLACGKKVDMAGDWAVDLSLSELDSVARSKAPKEAPFKLKLKQDGTFEMYPFFLEGKWNLASSTLTLVPTTASPPLEVMMTGRSVGKTPTVTMELVGNERLTWTPTMGNPSSKVKFVFTK